MNDARQTYSWKDPRSNPNDRALACHFEENSEVNEKITADTGIQTYNTVLSIVVYPMGQPKSNVAHEIERTFPDGTVEVNKYHANRYGGPLALYKAGRTAESAGTPLHLLPGMNEGTKSSLKARGVHTIEMLNDMSDSASQDIMGFWALREAAKTFIQTQKDNAPGLKMAAMEADYEKKIGTLQRQLDDLLARMPEAEKKPVKKAA